MRLTSALAALALAPLTALPACGGDDEPERTQPPPPARTATAPSASTGGEAGELARTEGEPRLETVTTGLDTPWEIAFLPDGRALVTERPDRVRLLSSDLELRAQPVSMPGAEEIGEGGLLGLAVDPEFEENGFVYLYRTRGGGNEVVRFRFVDQRLQEDAVIVSDIQAAAIHDGGRLRFGPDDRLYISTGDAAQADLAQDSDSLNGKLLRLDPGQYRVAGGRPEIVSLGHRNPQGFDWQPGTDRLYEDEHGNVGNDEINLIEPGANYGWPEAEGTEHDGFTAPLAVYEDSIAPSGASFVHLPDSEWSGDYLVGCLVGEQIRRLRFDGQRVTVNEPLFQGELGRVRTVVEGPDGALYALTSNLDDRGSPREGDDRIVRIVPPAS